MGETQFDVDQHMQEQRDRLAQDPKDSLARYNLATALIGRGRLQEAEQEFKRVIQDNLEFAEAYVQLGGLAMHRGDMAACLSFNQKASEIRPRFAVPKGNIGFVYLQQGEVDKAIKNLRHAISLDPQYVQAISTLGSAYLMSGDIEGCIEESQKAIGLQPTFGPAYNNLMLAYMETGEYQKAAEQRDLAEKYGYKVPDAVKEELANKLQGSK